MEYWTYLRSGNLHTRVIKGSLRFVLELLPPPSPLRA